MSWSEDPDQRAGQRERARARALRRRLTEPEQRLWRALRQHLPQPETHFRRQVPIGRYVVDFCCLSAKLVIEVGGHQHGFERQLRTDAIRTAFLNSCGFRVLRFSNRDVMTELQAVLDTIYAELNPQPEAGSDGQTIPSPLRGRWPERRRSRCGGPDGGRPDGTAALDPAPPPPPTPPRKGEESASSPLEATPPDDRRPRLTRRQTLLGAGAFIGAACLPGARARAAEPVWSHGLSTFGDLRYGPDFAHFAYVDPAAAKGGSFSTQISTTTGNQNFDTFNTLNVFVLKGDGAAGMPMTFDSLMARALDEPDALYGLVAEAVMGSPDGLTYRWRLRPGARFHDGTRITAADAAFSFMLLKEKGHPRIAQSLAQMERAETEGDNIVRVTFAAGRARDLPQVVATLPIFSAAYYKAHDFEAATLAAPLGSGPYRVGRYEVGRFITFERVKDYWAAALPANVGQNNFDEIRFEYFRDRQVAFEAFKAGAFTWREEFTARLWATGYDFPAIAEGKVRRETLADETPSGMQGWFFNLRRPKFQDPRIREAIGLAFDFAWVNTNIMYGAYTRTASYFENSDLKASGPPSPEEAALLTRFKGQVPDEVFGEPYGPPKSDGSGQDRALLRQASALLTQAGCKREGATLKRPDGAPLTIEFLDFQPTLQPHTQPFIKNLALLGIVATIRIVDAAQYQRREEDFDFDITVRRYSTSPTPGEALRQVFGSAAAATKGSLNLAGISSPAIDALLETILSAETRPALTNACRALDRVLRAGRYWVPMWYRASHPIAYWDMYAHPPKPPKYDLGAPATWWYDPDKARRIGKA